MSARSQEVVAASAATPNPAEGVLNRPRGVVPRWDQATGTAPARPAATQSVFSNPQCPACAPPLVFHPNVPVMGNQTGQPGHVTITPIYWNPTGSGLAYTATYKTIINGYLQNLAAASGQSSNVFSVATQYYQQLGSNPRQNIQYVVSAGLSLDDTNGYPPQGVVGPDCTPNASRGYTVCVTDAQLVAQLTTFLAANSRPMNDANLYMVFFPSSVETCIVADGQPNQACSSTTFCGYHSGVGTTPSNTIIYSDEPFPTLGCGPPAGDQSPNGDPKADGAISIASHEASEAITDSYPAWYDRAGYENGDECVYTYGLPLGGSSGTLYNQVINGGHYYTQDEFSNQDYAIGAGDLTQAGGVTVTGCVQREELPTASFAIPQVMAGNPATFSGSGSDPDNTAALTYSWSWGDGSANSMGATATHTFAGPGSPTVSLSVTDGDLWVGSVSHVVAVSPPTVPGPPTGVVASPGDGMVSLTWTAPANNGGRAISGHTVTPFIGGVAQTAISTGSAATSFSVTGLTNQTTYTFTVAATNAVGTGSPSVPSNAVTPIAAAVPGGSLGGVLTSGPGASSWASNWESVFARGTANDLVHKYWAGSQWSAWQSLGGVLTSDPAAVSWGPNRIDVFVRGTDNGLWHKWWDGAAWSGWEPLGGILTAGPDVASQGSGRLDVVVRGTDNGLWHKSFDAAGWHGWEAVGGVLTADPAAVSWGSGRLDVFIRGGDGGLWHTFMDSTGWHGWSWLGGYMTTSPAASSCASGQLDVFTLGTDNGLWRISFNGTWGTWQPLGGNWTSAPAAVCRQGGGSTDVFVRATDSSLWHVLA